MTERTPAVSVGLPVRNGADHLREAIDSVFAQDFDDWELVVSDNASDDATPDIVRSYAARDPRVRFERVPAFIPVGDNFRTVRDRARGRYFTWLGHDDSLWSPNWISETVGYLDSHPEVSVCGSRMLVLGIEGEGTSVYPNLQSAYPDADWPRLRAYLMRYPYTNAHYDHSWWLFYGMFRLDALAQARVGNRTILGRSVARAMEYPVLAKAATLGRVVALPHLMRMARHREASIGQTESMISGKLETILLGIRLKQHLVRVAASAPLPFRERLALTCRAASSFLSNNLGTPIDPRRNIELLRNEIKMLRKVCEERLEAIHVLDAELQRLRAAAEPTAARSESDEAGSALARLAADEHAGDTLLALLRDAEARASEPARFRDEVRWPIVETVARAAPVHVRLEGGVVFEVHPDSRIERSLLLSTEQRPDHVWEPQTTRLLLALAVSPGDAIVGGAYIGDQALPLAAAMLGSGGTVHAFEAAPLALGRLERNLALNDLPNVVVKRLALWDEPGVRLRISGEAALGSCEPAEDGTALSTTIDVYVERHALRVCVVALDLEGGEERALRGATSVLSRPDGPHLVFEVHSDYVDWSDGLARAAPVAFVMSHGYTVFAIRDYHDNRAMHGSPIEIVPIDDVYLEGPPHGFNVLATKDGGLVERLGLIVVPGVSPKLIAGRDSPLHRPAHGFQ